MLRDLLRVTQAVNEVTEWAINLSSRIHSFDYPDCTVQSPGGDQGRQSAVGAPDDLLYVTLSELCKLGFCSQDGPAVPSCICSTALFLQRCLEMLRKERNNINGQWLEGNSACFITFQSAGIFGYKRRLFDFIFTLRGLSGFFPFSVMFNTFLFRATSYGNAPLIKSNSSFSFSFGGIGGGTRAWALPGQTPGPTIDFCQLFPTLHLSPSFFPFTAVSFSPSDAASLSPQWPWW